MKKQYATLNGIKRAAIKLKRRTGIKHNDALNQIAREAGFADYFAATVAYDDVPSHEGHAITIYEFWSDREAGTRGNESRIFLLPKPLGEIVKPHQLTGWLAGSAISDLGLIGYGRSDSRAQARGEICRMARTLQFMAATGLKPSRGGRCYPKGDPNYRPPGADHDQGWYDPATRAFLLTEEPYPGRHQSHAEDRKGWAAKHRWRTVRSHWGSMYGHGTELYLTAKAPGRINLAGLARKLAALPAPFNEFEWPGDEPKPSFPPVERIEMSPELSAALNRQRDIDIAAAGPQAPELSGMYRGVDLSSRWDIRHELTELREIVDTMPDYVRERIASICCNSNAGSDYWVQVQPNKWFGGIDYEVRDVFRAVTSGWNGLLIRDDHHEQQFGPEWEGDDYDYESEALGEPVEVKVDDL